MRQQHNTNRFLNIHFTLTSFLWFTCHNSLEGLSPVNQTEITNNYRLLFFYSLLHQQYGNN